MLKGGSNLEAHVGHKVQVMGRASAAEATRTPAATSGTTANADAAATAARTFEVESVKMIAASCP
jgi:hypothetical protein